MANKKMEPDVQIEDVIVEEIVELAAAEPVAQVAKPSVYVAAEGDSYASIAAKLDRGSLTKFEFAKWLHDLNGGKSITEGTEVKL